MLSDTDIAKLIDVLHDVRKELFTDLGKKEDAVQGLQLCRSVNESAATDVPGMSAAILLAARS